MNLNRGSFFFAIGLAVVTAAFAETGTFSYASFSYSPDGEAGGAVAKPAVIREQEWIVSEIAGSMLNIAAFADHFEPGDPFQVRNAGSDPSGARFKVTRRVEEYTITTLEAWAPEPYVRMARSLMADGAGLTISEDAVPDRVDGTGPQAVSRLLQSHPRSALVHQRAAFLLGLSVQKRAAAAGFDPRPTLCRMTAHLAIARALHPEEMSRDGKAAERMLMAAAAKQPDAATPPLGGERPQFWTIEQ
jgi:hypothetical protein